MDIFVSGSICKSVYHIATILGKTHKVIVAPSSFEHIEKNKYITCFEYSFDRGMYANLFSSFHFDSAVFALQRGEQNQSNNKQGNSLDELNLFLELCKKNKVTQIIILSSSEVYSGSESRTSITEQSLLKPGGHTGFLLKTAEDICYYYKEKYDMDIIILHLPYVFCNDDADSFLWQSVQCAATSTVVALPGYKNTYCDFISVKDIAELIWRIVDEGYSGKKCVFNVGSGHPLHMEEFSRLLTEEFPNITIRFTEDETNIPVPVNPETVKQYYDWVALYDLGETLHEIVQEIKQTPRAQRSFWDRIKQIKFVGALRGKARLGFEFVGGMVLSEFLIRSAGGGFQMQNIDIRLAFVVLISSLHGMKLGILSIVYACISLIITLLSQNRDWRIIVYNTENWYPFIVYLVAGIVMGAAYDKKIIDHNLQKRQIALLQQDQIFISELYKQTLLNKAFYRDQIVGYRDSFGRIFNVAQRLDSLMPDQVFAEAINVLEDILNNNSIAIYTVSHGKYARLIVRSSELNHTEISIQLSNYNMMLENISPNKIWFNRDLIKNYPMYCAPIYANGELTALIMVYDVETEQMSAYYMNLIQVIAGLIQVSLTRAAEYNAAIEEKRFIPDTRILREDAFYEIYAIRKKMEEKKLLNFTLLRIEKMNDDLVELSKKIESCIRDSDVVGMFHNAVYLMLTRASKEGNAFVIERLSVLGLHFAEISAIEDFNTMDLGLELNNP